MTVPAGARVMLLVGSTNRDGRQHPDPDSFGIRRNPTDHLTFGQGVHHCVGAPLARLEAHAVIRALAQRVARLEVLDDQQHLNNVIRGPETLRIRSA